MIRKIALIICLSNILALTSCHSLRGQKTWDLPPKPNLKTITFEQIAKVKNPTNGFFLSNEQAVSLANNIDELKAYIEKLELLIKTINKEM